MKIISLIVAGLFLLNEAVYGIDLSNKSHLRVPIASNSAEGRKRVEDAVVNVNGLAEQGHDLLKEAYIEPPVNLSLLIGVLRELARHGYDNDYYLDIIGNSFLSRLVSMY